MLVTFENHRDKEDVLQASKCLRKSVISVTEDLSKKTRECRSELRRFMRYIKKTAPEKKCFLEYDKLFVDGKMFAYSEEVGAVEEVMTEKTACSNHKQLKAHQNNQNNIQASSDTLTNICCNVSNFYNITIMSSSILYT